MNKRIATSGNDTRLLNVQELMSYIGTGRNTAVSFGKEHGALVRIGSRTLFDKVMIDKALDAMRGSD